jgi:hypothetical protein
MLVEVSWWSEDSSFIDSMLYAVSGCRCKNGGI